MRVSPVSFSRTYALNRTFTTKKEQPAPQTATSSPSFKGVKAGAASTLGCALGVGLGLVFSGGLLAPALLGMSGTVLGGIYGQSKEDPSDYDGCEPTYPDYWPS